MAIARGSYQLCGCDCLLPREGFCWAGYSVTRAIGISRINLVIVDGVWFEVERADTKHRVRMLLVQPDMRSGFEIQVVRVCAIVQNREMLVRSSGIVARPADDGLVVKG
jgi:hypothetical protein